MPVWARGNSSRQGKKAKDGPSHSLAKHCAVDGRLAIHNTCCSRKLSIKPTKGNSERNLKMVAVRGMEERERREAESKTIYALESHQCREIISSDWLPYSGAIEIQREKVSRVIMKSTFQGQDLPRIRRSQDERAEYMTDHHEEQHPRERSQMRRQ